MPVNSGGKKNMRKHFMKALISILLAVSEIMSMQAFSIHAKTNVHKYTGTDREGQVFEISENTMVKKAGTDSLYGDFSYRISEDQTCILTKYTGREMNVIIPAQMDGYEVKAIGDKAFEGCQEMISVEIPDSVASIGKKAFCACPKLESVVIPDSVMEMRDHAFASCENLTSVKLSESITKLEDCVFWECGKLSEIHIPDRVKEICYGAFYFTNIKRVIIPDGVTKVPNYAFGTAVEYVSLPEDTEYTRFSFTQR